MKNIFSKAFLYFLFIGFTFSTEAQMAKKKSVDSLTDDEVVEFFQKANNSGLKETEIENLALSQGYSKADVQKMRERISRIGKSNNNTNSKNESTGRTTDKSQDFSEIEDKSLLDEKNLFNTSDIKKNSLGIFGENLFRNKNLTFEPNLRIPTPKNYILGPDDELVIDVFGDVLDNFKVKISPEGTVKILNLSPIYVNGLSIDEATNRIISRMRQLYQGLNKPGSGSSAVVSLGNVRSINVTIVGEAKIPGTYTISSLATVFNALYQAGGPSFNGSMRNIKIIRNGKVIRVLDVYDFLLRGDQKDNIQLHDQDIIRIAEYETRVSVLGEVKRPMIYEINKSETLNDVLRYAGGFTDKAYTYSISVSRNTSREMKLMNITQDEVSKFLPNNGDVFKVGAILERYENRVEIIGAVFRPGEYAIENGLTTVKELVKKAEGLRENAFLNRAILTRKKENFDPQIISFEIGKLMRGEIADIPLQREDILSIYFQNELKEKQTITIDGDVNKAGVFDFYEGMRLADAILLASGFKSSASFSKIEIARRIINPLSLDDNNGQTTEIFTVPIDGDLKISDQGSQILLSPFDKISVKSSPTFEKQRNINVSGQVNFPGNYTLANGRTKVSDLIEIAGGLRSDSYPGAAKLFRNSITVGFDLNKALENPTSEENISLIDGDQLFIPRNNETVKISGAVQNPIFLTFNQGKSLSRYISEAGGITENGIRNKIYVIKANGKSDRIRRFLFFKHYPKVDAGSEIIVPNYPADRKKALTTGEVIGLTSSLTTISIALISLIRILQ